MSTTIKCPNCQHEFEPNDSIREEVQKELRNKMTEWQKLQQQKLDEQLTSERNKIQKDAETVLRKSITADFENKFNLQDQINKENEEKLKQARQQQLEFLQKERELKNKEAELELALQRKINEEREKLVLEIKSQQDQKLQSLENDYKLKEKQWEEKFDAQKKLADEMKRKAEQGSMQMQGEVQELALEEMLRAAFPFDVVTEVGKGIRGADCTLTVRNNFGQECGKIIFESKRTKDFGADWIEKLKTDLRSVQADVGVIVSQTLPKDISSFGEKEGVWICSFNDVKPVVQMLRDAIIKIAAAQKSQENKGDKMSLLYNYLTSSEFTEQWRAIREGFMSMKISIQKERDAMEKLWKAREKQLEKVLLNATHIRGSIDGISGQDVDLNLLTEGDESEER
ncbi:MAG TPA: DUF2130 domain-containing protein [Chitinophagaceae bacterium]|jgi:hypothetical protein|nr:DUF2130 domain-containing protein [Chitinophagaceae bacterium]